MSVPADTAERHARQLARYAEIAMRAAEKLDSAIEAADDPQTLTALVGSLHKAGRALRTSIALEAKLQRDAAADARAAEEAGQARERRDVETRKSLVRKAVERRLWAELESSEAEDLADDLDERLDAEVLDAGFLAEPVDAQIERLARDLGLAPRPIRAAGAAEAVPDGAQPRLRPLGLPPDAEPPPGALPSRLAPPVDPPSWETG